MRLCYIDAFSGIAGDMTVGALLDAGADFHTLEAALASLGTGAVLTAEKTKRNGITATKFHVDGGEQKAHRHLHHIVRLIEAAQLSDRAKQTSLAVFQRLGEAEAKVHGVGIEKVHFHEVGAVDSICDIVGACVCLDLLGIDSIAARRSTSAAAPSKPSMACCPCPRRPPPSCSPASRSTRAVPTWN